MHDDTRDSRTALRDRLLLASLPHVAFDGWGRDALLEGARDADIDPAEIPILFRALPDDAIDHFADLADRRMLEALSEDPGFATLRTRDKVRQGVAERIAFLAPYKEPVRRAVAILSRPSRAPLSARLVWRSSDRIWVAAGDTATDFNRYSKRGLLSGIIGSTTLYWLNEQDPDYPATLDFLERRIETVLKIGGMVGRLGAMPRRMAGGFCRGSGMGGSR